MCTCVWQVLDVGLSVGSWSIHALDMGCQVIAFDKDLGAVNRMVQTVAKARNAQGNLMLESFHGFVNAVR